MGIAFVEMASPRDLGTNAPGFLLIGQQLLSGLALCPDDLHAPHGADGAGVDEALRLAVPGHAPPIVGDEAAGSRLGECGLNLFGLRIAQRDGLFQIAMLSRRRDGKRLALMAIGGRGHIHDVDGRVGEELFHRPVYASVAMPSGPFPRLFGGTVPYSGQLRMIGEIQGGPVLCFHHVAAPDDAPPDNAVCIHSSSSLPLAPRTPVRCKLYGIGWLHDGGNRPPRACSSEACGNAIGWWRVKG